MNKKLWEQSMCHVDAVPCANFNTSVHLQSGNYLNKHAQPISENVQSTALGQGLIF